MTQNTYLTDSQIIAKQLRQQTELLKSIRNGVSLIAVMLLVFAVVLILAIVGASA